MKKYVIIPSIIISILTCNAFASYQDERDLARITELISVDETLHNDIYQLRLKPNYKALAIAINDQGNYVYWYTYNMNSQKVANNTALANCRKASKEHEVHKSCKLYNDIINKVQR